MWPKSRGVLSPDPTLLPGGTHRLDTRLVVSAHSSKSVWWHTPPGKLNTGKMLLKTFLSILSAILGKQTFDTWYGSTLWGSYHRLFVTAHSSYIYGRCLWACSEIASNLSMFRGKQGYDSIDCDHMEIDLVILQIQGLNMAARTSLTWPQFRDEHQSQANQIGWIVQNPDVASPFVSSGNAVCRYE